MGKQSGGKQQQFERLRINGEKKVLYKNTVVDLDVLSLSFTVCTISIFQKPSVILQRNIVLQATSLNV